MNRKNELLFRVYLVLLLFIIGAAVIFSRAFRISIVEGEKWRKAGENLYVKYIPIDAERGNILASDGSLLATSLQFFDIRMDLNSSAMSGEDFLANIDSLAICLSQYVNPGKTPSQYKNYLIKKRKEGERYLLLKRDATYEELKRIRGFPLFRLGRYKGGLIWEPRSRREKPYRQLASRTIGTFRKNARMVGLEDAFEDILAGEEGKRLMQRVGPNTWIPVNDLSEIEPKRGYDIVTTLDMDMQDAVHHTLRNALEMHKAEYGVAVVMEVETGAIRAISNLSRTDNGYFETYNHAVGTLVEPGSTFKLASVMALLEDGFADLDDVVKVDRGRTVFCGSQVLEDSDRHGLEEMTMEHAFTISSNVGIARLTSRHYKADKREALFIERLKQFHLHEITGISISGEGRPEIKEAYNAEQKWSCTSIPWMSIGYELKLSPLQLLTFYNAVANNGKMMQPYLVQGIRNQHETVKTFTPVVLDHSIASASTIEKAKYLLRSAVERGTGKKIQSSYLDFAGKTGTAQIDYWKGSGRKKHQASFAGYFPAENPRYSCIVVISNPRKHGYYASAVAGPVFREIAERCYGIQTLQNQATAGERKRQVLVPAMLPNYQVAYRVDVKSILDYTEVPYVEASENDWIILISENDRLQLKKRDIPDELVPNVVNMGLKDALYVLGNRGLEAEVKGSGRVVKQSIPPGSRIDGQSITLTLH